MKCFSLRALSTKQLICLLPCRFPLLAPAITLTTPAVDWRSGCSSLGQQTFISSFPTQATEAVGDGHCVDGAACMYVGNRGQCLMKSFMAEGGFVVWLW